MRAPACYGYVYKTILPDGRFYIGQKKSDHIVDHYYGSGKIIDNWFRKYTGEPSFNCPKCISDQYCIQREVLGYAIDCVTLNAMEIAYITDAKVYDCDHECLNIHGGGRYDVQHVAQEDVNRKISEALKGKRMSAHAVAKAQATKRKRRKPISEETRQRMSSGIKRSFDKRVIWNKGLTKDIDERLIRQYDLNRPPVSEQTRSALSEATRGTQWYNNGLVNVRRTECPDGFAPGMLPFKSARKKRTVED